MLDSPPWEHLRLGVDWHWPISLQWKSAWAYLRLNSDKWLALCRAGWWSCRVPPKASFVTSIRIPTAKHRHGIKHWKGKLLLYWRFDSLGGSISWGPWELFPTLSGLTVWTYHWYFWGMKRNWYPETLQFPHYDVGFVLHRHPDPLVSHWKCTLMTFQMVNLWMTVQLGTTQV